MKTQAGAQLTEQHRGLQVCTCVCSREVAGEQESGKGRRTYSTQVTQPFRGSLESVNESANFLPELDYSNFPWIIFNSGCYNYIAKYSTILYVCYNYIKGLLDSFIQIL